MGLGHKLGFIGAGQMAKAIGLSIVRKGLLTPSSVFVSSPEESHLEDWKAVGCTTTAINSEVIDSSDVILWAVKPQYFIPALKEVQLKNESTRKFHISIMAGLPLQFFTKNLQSHFQLSTEKIVTARVMPNIGMKVYSGCAVYTLGERAEEMDKVKLVNLLSSIGLCFEVPEGQINAYCGLFASGIGFMFPVLEAMSDGGVKMGLPRDISTKIAAQTMKGAAELILNDEKTHPGILKDSVCSPGGTTIAGIAELERNGVRNGIISAIEAATKRGEEIGKLESVK